MATRIVIPVAKTPDSEALSGYSFGRPTVSAAFMDRLGELLSHLSEEFPATTIGVPFVEKQEVVMPAKETTQFRFTDHSNQLDDWCPWSHVSVSEKLADSDDRRCPAGCPASGIEEDD